MAEAEKKTVPGYPVRNLPELIKDAKDVRELHKPQEVEGIAWECYQGDCEHDDECPSETFWVCAECYGLTAEVDPEMYHASTVWPCKTATTLGVAA